MGLAVPKLWANMDIDLGDQGKPTPLSSAAVKTDASSITPVTTAIPTESIQREPATPTPSSPTEAAPIETPTPRTEMIQGVLKAKDIYQAGIKCYHEKDYEKAIAYLKKAVSYEDPYTPRYIIAEAYATLGVIYQFYFPVEGNLKIAAENYKKALRYEPTNPTALKYLYKLKKMKSASE